MDDHDGCIIVVAVVILLLVIAFIVARCTMVDKLEAECIAAGYDGHTEAESEHYCYHIVDGSRVLVPMSVIPKPQK